MDIVVILFTKLCVFVLFSAFGCPYSEINMKKEVVLPDRLGGEKQITFVPVQRTKRLCTELEEEEENDQEICLENRLAASSFVFYTIFHAGLHVQLCKRVTTCFEMSLLTTNKRFQ